MTQYTITVFVILASFSYLCWSSPVNTLEKQESQKTKRQTPSTSSSSDGFWPCPTLVCPDVTGCQDVEVVAWVIGGTICEGCPYCLDDYARRRRRGMLADIFSTDFFQRQTLQNLPIVQNEVCSFVDCPTSRPTLSCHRPGIIDGYYRGDKCISCAYCSDPKTSNSPQLQTSISTEQQANTQ